MAPKRSGRWGFHQGIKSIRNYSCHEGAELRMKKVFPKYVKTDILRNNCSIFAHIYYIRKANMKQKYAWAFAVKPEDKITKKETITNVSFQIGNKDIKEQYTLKL